MEMLKSIKQIAGKIDVPQNGYAAKVKLAYLDQLMSSSTTQQERLSNVLKKGIVLLEYGDEANAVEIFKKIIHYVGDNPKARVPTLYWLGTAYLRLAERNNCVAGHTADACILPLQASGIHKDKSPSRKAIETFETFLKESPEDPNYYDVVWLLNIAYMTVGEYPGKVPKKWLLPNLDKPEYQMKPFVDIATQLNIMVNSRAGGSIVDDFNNDGFLDLVTSGWDLGEDKMYYFQNNGDGTFSNASKSLGLNHTAYSMGANNDGFLDFYLGTGNIQKGHGVSIADIDNDGDQDIHVEMGGAYRGDGYPNSMYLNPDQNKNNWIYLKIEGTKSNRASIGAKITVKFRENGVPRMVYRELNSGGSFGSNPLRREIGIGTAAIIEEIRINWPTSGITQVLTNVEPNQLLHIVEGKEGAVKLPLQKISFHSGNPGMPMCAPTQ